VRFCCSQGLRHNILVRGLDAFSPIKTDNKTTHQPYINILDEAVFMLLEFKTIRPLFGTHSLFYEVLV
jgi:hypothetical protein